MRNLKKVLSLALALVMLLGMMVVGAGAATDFKDADSIENTEAVDVVSGIGVLQGDENGYFNPEGTLTRAEAAVVVAKLDLGAAFGNLETTNASTFSDVPAGYWGKPYIDYCFARGLIAGVGNNKYNPNGKVTGVEFALMVSRVLGYEDKAEQIGGADWEVDAAALARKAGLTVDVTLGSHAMTRDEMAQVAYNALKADMVEYKNGTIDITVGGTPVTIGGNPATAKENKGAHYDKSAKQDNILQLCEEKFPQLTVESSEDNFQRPANVWTYKRTDIAEVPTAAHAEYTTTTKGTTIATALKPESNATVEYYVNGLPITSMKTVANVRAKADFGANGVLTQAWYNENTNTVKITEIHTYVGRVSSVTKATATADRFVSVTADPNSRPGTVNSKFETEDFAARDVVLYTAFWDADNEEYVIESVSALGEPDTGRLTAWKGTSYNDGVSIGNANSNFTSNGNTYNYSAHNVIVDENGSYRPNGIAGFTVNVSDINVYTDKYDYAIYISGVEAEKNYAAVIGIGSVNQYGSGANGCTLLFPDGTQKSVNFKMASGQTVADLTSNNYVNDHASAKNDGYEADIVTYRVLDDGTYELRVVDKDETKNNNVANDMTFTSGKSVFTMKDRGDDSAKTLYTTSNTIFFVATKGTGDNLVYNVYTGYNNAPGIDPAKAAKGFAIVTNSYYTSQIDVVYLGYESMSGITSVDAVFAKAKGATIYTDSTGSYYELPAVVDGEVTTLKFSADITKLGLKGNTLTGVYAINSVIKNSHDIITDFTDVSSTSFTNVNGVAGTVAANGVVLGVGDDGTAENRVDDLIAKATYWAYNDNTKVYAVSKDYKTIEAIDITSVGTDLDDKVYASTDTTGGDKKVKDVFIVEDGAKRVTYSAGASANVEFATSASGPWSKTLSNVTASNIYVRAVNGYKVTAASATENGLGSPNGQGIYTVTAKDIAAGAIATEIDNTSPVYATGVNGDAVNAADNLNLKDTADNVINGTSSKINVVDGISIGAQIKELLAAQGYTLKAGTNIENDATNSKYKLTVVKDDMESAVEFNYGSTGVVTWYPVVDEAGTVLGYTKAANDFGIDWTADDTKAGTGVIWQKDGDSSWTYISYSDLKTTKIGATNKKVIVKAGYVSVSVTSAMDKTGATTGTAGGAVLTAAKKSDEVAYAKADTAVDYNVTISVGTAATDAAVNVVATAPTDAVVTPTSLPVTASGNTANVKVALTAAMTAGDVTITLKVVDPS